MSGNKQKNKKRRTHSLNREITLIFVGILALTIGACILINSLFLEKVYVNDKKDTLVSVFNKLDNLSEMTEEAYTELQTISNTHNVGIALYSSVFEPVFVISYEPKEIMIN